MHGNKAMLAFSSKMSYLCKRNREASQKTDNPASKNPTVLRNATHDDGE